MDTFEDRIHRIVADREHGSSTLVQMIIDALAEADGHCPTPSQQRWALRELKRIDHSMVVVHHLLDTLGTEPGDNLAARVRQYAQQWSGVASRITRHLLDYHDWTDAQILLHSHSGLLLKAATEVCREVPGIGFWQTRSEPGGEGVSQYRELRRRGIPCSLLSDEAAVDAAATFDAAWLGVDQYDSSAFVNKVGSRRITGALVVSGKEVLVLGDSRKRVGQLDYSGHLFEAVPFMDGVRLVTEGGVSPATAN